MLKVVQSLKPKDFSLKMEIHRRLAGWEKARPHFPLRASTLLKEEHEFCPREHALLDLGFGKQKDQFVGTALRMTFNHGRFLEESIREDYLRDLTIGRWECDVCKTKHPTFGKVPKVTCPGCGYSGHWKYIEPRFEDPYTGVSGGTDMLIDVGNSKATIVELKSMAPDMFKGLAAPLAEHKVRTSLYLYLASVDQSEEAKRVNTSESKILYVMKSFGMKDDSIKAAGIADAAFSPLKEFSIKRDDSLFSLPMAKARVLKVWRDTKSGMPCGVCPNSMSKRAAACGCVASCFSGKFPSTLTWETKPGSAAHQGKTLIT